MAFTPSEEALLRQLLDQNTELLNLADSESEIISKLGATKVTLSDLDAASSPNDSDLLLARQGTEDKNLTLSLLRSYAQGNVVLLTGDQHIGGTKTIDDSLKVPNQPDDDDTENAANTHFVQVATADFISRVAPAQEYQDVTGNRSLDTTYYNIRDYPYYVMVVVQDNGAGSVPTVDLFKNGQPTVTVSAHDDLDGGESLIWSFMIYPDQSYRVNSDGCNLKQWVEAHAV